jgi:hypothetical protein
LGNVQVSMPVQITTLAAQGRLHREGCTGERRMAEVCHPPLA